MFIKKGFPVVENYVSFFVENYDDMIVYDKSFTDKVATNDLFFTTMGCYDRETKDFNYEVVMGLYGILKKHYDKEYKSKRCDKCGHI